MQCLTSFPHPSYLYVPLYHVHSPFVRHKNSCYTASTPQPSRWWNPIPTTFRCLWISRETQCSAPIAGDRRSVTSHLRHNHNFVCDGQIIACAWAGCTASMQRRNIPRHIIACHLPIKVTCSQCGLPLSRADARQKHQLACLGVRTTATMEATEEDEESHFYTSK